jgi:hypothetical protein
MKDFLLIFRRNYTPPEIPPADEVWQAHLKHWQDWFRKLAAQELLARPIQRWDPQGLVIWPGARITNGPYIELKDAVVGVITIKAKDYDEAAEIAKGCPVMDAGGSVEVRMGN